MRFGRLYVLLLIIFSPAAINAQSLRSTSWIESHSPKLLAKSLTANLQTDRQKVEAIFRWIADNIEYRVKPGYYYRRPTRYEEDTATILKPLNERVAEQVLETGVAFCEGYARLFSTLCDY